jgi:lipoprotein-releasing system permease protein
LNLSLFIAKRYLISKKSHNAINIITFISIAGVSIVTMSLIIVLSAFNGISALVLGLYNTFDPDIKISPKEGKTFTMDPDWERNIKKLNGVAFYTEVLQENALLKYDDKQVIATIKGVSDDFVKMTRLDTVIKEGQFLLKSNSLDYAVIGYGIARKLTISPSDFGNPLEIYVPKRGSQAVINPEDAFLIRSIEVSGVFSLNDDFDNKYALIPLSLARTLLNRATELSSIEIGLKPGSDLRQTTNEIKNIMAASRHPLPSNTQKKTSATLAEGQSPDDFNIKTRYEQNEILFKTINSEKLWVFIILAFILMIATFNVIGSLTMLIIEKKKDIQTLLFLGADKALIRKIFMREGLMITLTGALSGLVFGLFLCWVQIKFKPVPFSEGFIVDAYPIKVIPADIALVLGTVLLIGFFAAWYPVKVFTRKFN